MKNILVLGGTRFFGIPMVDELLNKGHSVTIATRGNNPVAFHEHISHIKFDRNNPESLKKAFRGRYYDVIVDKIAYCSNDIKYLFESGVTCEKYILMSSAAVYENKYMSTREEDFDASNSEFEWCNRPDYDYSTVKRYAECALFQRYPQINSVAVRYPVVLGKNDYTGRLKFYVQHILSETPFYTDNLSCQMSYINEDEAGRFIAFLCDSEFTGTVNGCSNETISLSEIFDYIHKRTGKIPIIAENGDIAPYNGETQFSLNTGQANKLGYDFSELKAWIYELIDFYIDEFNDNFQTD